MKKLMIITILMAMATQMKAFKPLTKGGFETDRYRNVFVEMGYKKSQVQAKLQEVFNDVFRGPNKVYFEVGDTLGYISDIKVVKVMRMSYDSLRLSQETEEMQQLVKQQITAQLSEESKRLVSLMPRWMPGKMSGKSRNVRYMIPIQFP